MADTYPIIFQYPLDLYGTNPNNLVIGETHVLPAGTNRAIVPNYGAFYSESLVVRDADTNLPLIKGEQYKAVQLYQEATTKSGKEVTAIVLVTDPNVSPNIAIDYQVVGGEYTLSVIALRTMLEEINLDGRTIEWGDVLGKPLYFPPSPHLHDAGDIYGFEYLVEILDAVRAAIINGNEGSLQELRQYIQMVEESIRSQLYDHATPDEAIAGLDDLKVTSPLTIKAAFDNWANIYLADQEALIALNEHLSQHNPHQSSAASVGLGALENTAPATLIDVYNKMVESLGGSERGILEVILYDHLNASNPHDVTAADIGLSSLEGQTLMDGSVALNTVSPAP